MSTSSSNSERPPGDRRKSTNPAISMENDSTELDDLREKLSDELAPIFEALESIKTKDEIAHFFSTEKSESIKKLLEFILIDSPNESTRLLKKLIGMTIVSVMNHGHPFHIFDCC